MSFIRRVATRIPHWLRDCAFFGFGAGLLLALLLAPVAGSWWAVLLVFGVAGLFLTAVAVGLVMASDGHSGPSPQSPKQP